jgi:H+/Cl- antiporter ClcA
MDSSQAWVILVCTGVSVGIVAAAIDTVSDWLGDLKEGFCQATFYLNRGFCCWGIQGSHCRSGLGLNSRARILFRLVYLGKGVTCALWCRRIYRVVYFLCSFSGTFTFYARLT